RFWAGHIAPSSGQMGAVLPAPFSVGLLPLTPATGSPVDRDADDPLHDEEEELGVGELVVLELDDAGGAEPAFLGIAMADLDLARADHADGPLVVGAADLELDGVLAELDPVAAGEVEADGVAQLDLAVGLVEEEVRPGDLTGPGEVEGVLRRRGAGLAAVLP